MKLKRNVLEKIINNCTGKEIDFIIYIARLQNQSNNNYIIGITQKDVCETIKISVSKFYDIIKSLQEKDIIITEKTCHGYWNFKILYNYFNSNKSFEDGYINLNWEILYKPEFFELKKDEKIIILKIIEQYRESNKKYKIVYFTETLKRWTGRKTRAVKTYIESLKNIFSELEIDKKNKKLIINKPAEKEFTKKHSEPEYLNKHMINYIVKRFKIDANAQTLKDLLIIFQSRKKTGFNTIITAIIKCIENQGLIIPQYVNKMIDIIIKNKIDLVTIF